MEIRVQETLEGRFVIQRVVNAYVPTEFKLANTENTAKMECVQVRTIVFFQGLVLISRQVLFLGLRFQNVFRLEYSFCFEANGMWEKWGEFGECIPSCGPGYKERTRKCTGRKGNGMGCQGDDTEKVSCIKDPICSRIIIFEICTKYIPYKFLIY